MSTQFNISSNIKGVNGFGLPFCDTVYGVTLAANTEETVTVPSAGAIGALGATIGKSGVTKDKYIAVFNYSGPNGIEAWVSVNATATVPGATFAAQAAEINPPAKYVYAGDVIHVISPHASTSVSVAFYTIQE